MFVLIFFVRTCSHKSETYIRFFEAIKKHLKSQYNLEWNPKACVSDYEKSFIVALQNQGIEMHGCKWHYTEALKRRLAHLKITDTEFRSKVTSIATSLFYANNRSMFNLHKLELKSKN